MNADCAAPYSHALRFIFSSLILISNDKTAVKVPIKMNGTEVDADKIMILKVSKRSNNSRSK